MPWLTWGKFDLIVNVTLSAMFAFFLCFKVSFDILIVITAQRIIKFALAQLYPEILVVHAPVSKPVLPFPPFTF